VNHLFYETGQLEKIIESKTPHIDRVLFALAFTCDPEYFFDKTREMIGSAESKWHGRIALLRAAIQINSGAFQAANKQLSMISENSLVTGTMDSFYVSLYRLLKILADIEFQHVPPDFTTNKALIGDSHTMSLSRVWRGEGSKITYLPGVTLRGISFPLRNSYNVGIENALTINQRLDDIVFSLGEIDIRNNYFYFRKITSNSGYKKIITSTIRAALSKIYAHKAPYQRFHIFALPGFNPSLVEENDKGNTNKVGSLYNFYRKEFNKAADDLGFLVVDHREMFNKESVNNLIDHAHFHPRFYHDILNGYSNNIENK
tara:strand:- start:1006 stop:1953 length:948 start_codon:yes stop_codon:yes gene_type:complete